MHVNHEAHKILLGYAADEETAAVGIERDGYAALAGAMRYHAQKLRRAVSEDVLATRLAELDLSQTARYYRGRKAAHRIEQIKPVDSIFHSLRYLFNNWGWPLFVLSHK